MPKAFIVLVASCVMLFAALLSVDASLAEFVAVLVSMLALVVALVSAFKEDIFPFQPSVLLDEVIFAPTTAPSHDSIAIVLPITFINKGNGAGVVHMLALRVERESKVMLYTPLVQIDFQKYLSGIRKLHADNIIGTFNSFALDGKEVAKKYLVFSQEEKSELYPFSKWEEGSYTFKLFLNQTNNGKALEIARLEKMQITNEMLANYKSGIGTSLCPSRAISV